MILLLGSSILFSIKSYLSEEFYVVAKKGGTLDFDWFAKELKSLDGKVVDKVVLCLLGGNDIWNGRLVRRKGQIHYHLGGEKLSIAEICSKYWVLYQKLKELFPKAKVQFVTPLCRRPFDEMFPTLNSKKCGQCLTFKGFSDLVQLEWNLKQRFSDTDCQIEKVQKLHKALFLSLGYTEHWVRENGSNQKNWQLVYKEILAQDQIHLSQRGKKIVSDYINAHLIQK